jgi:transposase-like protein
MKVYPYVFLAGIELKCDCGLGKKEASVLIAEGVDANGHREVLGVAEGGKQWNASWGGFLLQLKHRGLSGVRLLIGDRCEGLAEKLSPIFPGVRFQSSVVQFRNDVLALVPIGHLLEVKGKLELIDERTDRVSASRFVARTLMDFRRLRLPEAGMFYETHVWETLSYLAMPREHWRGLRSNSAQAKLLRSIRERTRMLGAFSDGVSAAHLVSARLRHVETAVSSEKRYLWGRL